jgi:hypothetical protein
MAVVVLVVCDVVVVGGGGVPTTPLLSICPASAQTERVRLRMVTTLILRKVFTFEPPN